MPTYPELDYLIPYLLKKLFHSALLDGRERNSVNARSAVV
jgi:hypothetical protein